MVIAGEMVFTATSVNKGTLPMFKDHNFSKLDNILIEELQKDSDGKIGYVKVENNDTDFVFSFSAQLYTVKNRLEFIRAFFIEPVMCMPELKEVVHNNGSDFFLSTPDRIIKLPSTRRATYETDYGYRRRLDRKKKDL